MPEKGKQSYNSLVKSVQPEKDIPGIIGDEWADPEEFLNDFRSDNVEAEIQAKKHLNSPLD